jgi:transcriptional regulator with XRE-family HTH domain
MRGIIPSKIEPEIVQSSERRMAWFEFGPLLRHYRVAAGFTQEELAERAGISARAISDMERGLRKRPYRDTVDRLTITLGLTATQGKELARLARSADRHSVSLRASQQLDVDDEHRAGAWSPAQDLPVGGFLGAMPSTPLVGRQWELERLLTTVDAVRNGSGRLVMLVGEPGAGKTRLAQEATMHLRENGFLLAAGRSYELEEQSSYYPFLDVLAAIHAAIPDQIREMVPAEWPYLSVLLPDLLGSPPVGTSAKPNSLSCVPSRPSSRRSRTWLPLPSCSTICTGPMPPASTSCSIWPATPEARASCCSARTAISTSAATIRWKMPFETSPGKT